MHLVSDKWTPYRVLVLGYAIVTVVGAALLALPVSSATGDSQPFADALFMAASAISTTGLCVVDIGSYYSLFGQIVMLCIVQIGGIGYMAFIVTLTWLLGLRLSHSTATAARESVSGSHFQTLRHFLAIVLGFTLICEALGALPLIVHWSATMSHDRAVYFGIWHSVNAFCTAGFGLMPDSLIGCRDCVSVNLTVIVLSLIGGMGFVVCTDLGRTQWRRLRRRHPRGLSLHSRLALTVTGVLVVLGSLLLLLVEPWIHEQGLARACMIAVFQVVSASTTDGFNSVDIGALSAPCLTFFMLLMFVGASPGSTGGGIKTTTFGVALMFIGHQLRGAQNGMQAMRRIIPATTVQRALAISGASVLVVFVDMVILTATEHGSFIQILFEIISALGNTGLSMGITASLTPAARLLLAVTMFIGRVGPLTLALALAGERTTTGCNYAEEDVYVG